MSDNFTAAHRRDENQTESSRITHCFFWTDDELPRQMQCALNNESNRCNAGSSSSFSQQRIIIITFCTFDQNYDNNMEQLCFPSLLPSLHNPVTLLFVVVVPHQPLLYVEWITKVLSEGGVEGVSVVHIINCRPLNDSGGTHTHAAEGTADGEGEAGVGGLDCKWWGPRTHRNKCSTA